MPILSRVSFLRVTTGLGLLFVGIAGFSVSAQAAITPKMDLVPFQATTSTTFVSAIVMTPGTHQVLYAERAEEVRSIASLTKLVSAMVWTRTPARIPWKKKVTLTRADEVGGGRLRVPVGSRMTFEDLWVASIAASANNTAMALARLTGLSKSALLKTMTQEAVKAGAKNAVFVDPSGMQPGNKASAHEMALIADRAFHQKDIQRAASTAKYDLSVLGPVKQVRHLKNTNALLTKDPDVWVLAGKTGYLEESQHNLAVWMRPLGVDGKPELGKDVLIVVFGSPDTSHLFATAKALAQWTWNSYEFPKISRLPR